MVTISGGLTTDDEVGRLTILSTDSLKHFDALSISGSAQKPAIKIIAHLLLGSLDWVLSESSFEV